MKKSPHIYTFLATLAIVATGFVFFAQWGAHLVRNVNMVNYYWGGVPQFGATGCSFAVSEWQTQDTFSTVFAKPHDFKPTKLPWADYHVSAPKPTDYAIIKCQVDLSSLARNGYAWMNLGRLIGDSAVFLNGRLTAELNDDGQAEFPLAPADRIKDASVVIISKVKPEWGLAGPVTVAPPVFSDQRIPIEKLHGAYSDTFLEMPIYRLGYALGLFMVFAISWLAGMRYRDIGWMLVITGSLAVSNWTYYTPFGSQLLWQRKLAQTFDFSLMLAFGGFLFSFFRLPDAKNFVPWVFIASSLMFGLLHFLIPPSVVQTIHVADYVVWITGIIIFTACGISGIMFNQPRPARRQKRVDLLFVLSFLAAAALGAECVLNFTLDVRLEYFMYFGLASVFAIFLAADMASYHGEYFVEKALHLESRENAIALQSQRDLEKLRGEILSRFMADSIVHRFKDGQGMEENLQSVLTPRKCLAGLLQADVRGYTTLASRLTPEDTARILRSYYRSFVEAAQSLAQIKLIGDSIFLFVEEENVPAGDSLADVVLKMACDLVGKVETLNALNRDSMIPVNLQFGMAIHVGEVVVGNLSCDSCIDYTVIGPEVNLVARLEELTKNPTIREIIGTNAIVLSAPARAMLRNPSGISIGTIELKSIDVSVRSFPGVDQIHYVAAVEAMAKTSTAGLALV